MTHRSHSRNVFSRVGSVGALVLLGLLTVGPSGCTRYQAPKFRVVSIVEQERSEQAVVLGFNLEAENRNDEPLPLERAVYSLTLDGEEVFRGSRIARVTAPRFGTQVLELPVVVPADAVPPGRFDAAGEMRYRLDGTVEYLTPGRFSEFLFDLNVRRPEAPIDVRGTLELPGGGAGASSG